MTGRVCNRFIKTVNQTSSEDIAKEAVFDYLNEKVRVGEASVNNPRRLEDKFNTAQAHFTRHTDATQKAYQQFMRWPIKLSCRDRIVAKQVSRATPSQVNQLIQNFAYTKLFTGWTVAQNQGSLAQWGAIIGTRLTHNLATADEAFAACVRDANALNKWQNHKATTERQQAEMKRRQHEMNVYRASLNWAA